MSFTCHIVDHVSILVATVGLEVIVLVVVAVVVIKNSEILFFFHQIENMPESMLNVIQMHQFLLHLFWSIHFPELYNLS